MADSTFLKALLTAFNSSWTRAFGDYTRARDAAKALDEVLTDSNLIGVPIGGIIWWHKALAGTPTLPTSFVECNGQVLNDADSIYDGLTMPDINVDGRFIRGNATSGTEQAADTLIPAHTHGAGSYEAAAHTHTQNVLNAGGGSAVRPASTTTALTVQDGGSTDSDGPHAVSGTSASGGASGTETHPINISMVAIMRIK